jgi:two-component system, chemotaxis family, protein-glutamate methylesterase/glutaminase
MEKIPDAGGRTNPRVIKALIVEDTPVICKFLARLLSADPELRVIGTVSDGAEAIEFLKHQKPDVITMDIHMPRMSGLEATRRIMETSPLPIVIVSNSIDPLVTMPAHFQALEAGAVTTLPIPKGLDTAGHEASAREFVQTVKLMSEIKMITRRPRPPIDTVGIGVSDPGILESASTATDIRIVGIGASAGGPQALRSILTGLPRELPIPVLMVQHIDAGFAEGFAAWLNESSNLPVHIASNGERLKPGHVYIPPGDYQMGVRIDGCLTVNKEASEKGLRPAVSYLFRSLANVYGSHAVGVLLTGMGVDGAAELKRMKDRGAVTIVQDEESSLVHGMPGEAIKLGAADYILPPEKIVQLLKKLIPRRNDMSL